MRRPTGEHASSIDLRCSIAFIISTLGAIAFIAVYVVNDNPQLEGVSAGISMFAFAFAMVTWGRSVLETVEQERRPMYEETSVKAERQTAAAVERGTDELARRKFLKYLVGASGAIGVAALTPVASLGPRPKDTLQKTQWQPGSRVVREDGSPVRADDITEGSMLTVFPEGFTGSADAQTVLLRLPPDELQLPADKADWAPLGIIAFSRVCTHAGCPVAQYQAESKQLLCPCHQSLFDVTKGAKPVFGPAPRPLPQLPLHIDEDGTLRAQSDFHTPVGPAFWSFSE